VSTRAQSPWERQLTVASIYLLLIVGAFLFIFPFVWMVATSLKPLEQSMTAEFTLVPRAYYVQVDGQSMCVKKDPQPITAGGFLVVVETGPQAGAKLLVGPDHFKDGKVRLDVQIADRFVTEWFPAKLVSEPKPGWIRVVEKPKTKYTDQQLYWTVVPPAAITERIEFQWRNYVEATRVIPFFKYTVNTLIVAILGMIGTTISSALAAYGFSRVEWRGRDFLFGVCVATMMVPFAVTMVPLYSVFKNFGMIGTLQPLWVPAWFASAFNIFLLRQFFLTLPHDISEAARIDGCNEFQIFYKVILPLAKPSLTVVLLFHFMWAWNDFAGPLIFLTKESIYTLALGLQAFQSQQGGTEWHYLMAASTLTILPIIALFFFAQKTFIEGISLTGSKG